MITCKALSHNQGVSKEGRGWLTLLATLETTSWLEEIIASREKETQSSTFSLYSDLIWEKKDNGRKYSFKSLEILFLGNKKARDPAYTHNRSSSFFFFSFYLFTEHLLRSRLWERAKDMMSWKPSLWIVKCKKI